MSETAPPNGSDYYRLQFEGADRQQKHLSLSEAGYKKLRDERDLYRKQADVLWAALERIVDANGRDGRAIARGVMERLRREAKL